MIHSDTSLPEPLPRVVVRRMTEHDLIQVEKIERLSFPTAWSAQAYRDELKQPYDYSLVAELEEAGRFWIAGYICHLLIPDETMLLKIAVHPDFRRLGIGSRLLSESLEYLISRGIRVVWLEVRATNLAAQAFYQAFGFTFFHTRKRYYSDTGEDALIMARLLKTEEDVK